MPSICLAAKSDAQSLLSILTMHARAPSTGKSGGSQRDNDIIAALTARISALEAELTACRAELQDVLAGQGGRDNGHAAAAAPSPAAAQQIVELVETAVTSAAHVPVGPAGDADDTLMQLMEHCRNCAQTQDKLMDRLAEELEFARTRLLNASKMGNQSGVTTARELLSSVRATSSEVHDAAARLEALVATLDTHISSSPAYSALRPMSMQVKHIAAQVYSAHNHLTARAWPDAILEEATNQNGKRGGRNISMDEILRMDVGGKGGRVEAASGSVASQDPASRVATRASSVSNAADARSPPQSAATQPHSAHGMQMAPAPVMPPAGVPPQHIMPPPGMAPVPHGFVMPAPVPVGGMVGQPLPAVVGSVPMPQPGVAPAPVVAMAPVHVADAGGTAMEQGVPVPQEPAPAVVASRFGSSLAVAEEAAANLSKLLPPSRPPATAGRSGGRAGARGRGGRRA